VAYLGFLGLTTNKEARHAWPSLGSSGRTQSCCLLLLLLTVKSGGLLSLAGETPLDDRPESTSSEGGVVAVERLAR
jgi:hypothetical protein